MTEQPEVVLATPKRRFRLHLPTRHQLKTVGTSALAGAAVATAVTLRIVKKDACVCEPGTTETADQPTS
jgi:hypothetical protein